MSAFVQSPRHEQKNVAPYDKLTLVFSGVDDISCMHARCNGQWVIREGACQPPFVTVDRFEEDGIIQWTLRHRHGWPCEDVLIHCWSTPYPSLKEHRFFVRGATASLPMREGGYTSRRCGPHMAGLTREMFWWGQSSWALDYPMSGGQVYWDGHRPSALFPGHGQIVWIDQDNMLQQTTIPKFLCRGARDIAIASHHYGLSVMTRHDDGVWQWQETQDIHRWDIHADGLSCWGGWWVAMMGSQTGFLPVGYDPKASETSLDSWRIWEHDHQGEQAFGHGMLAWWDGDSMIAHHHPNPLLERSSAVLWTSDDLGETIESVEIIGPTHAHINQTWLVNTKTPNIESL